MKRLFIIAALATGCSSNLANTDGLSDSCAGEKCDETDQVAAVCEANVRGTGIVPAEDDYLPHVIACENPAAPFEALKAQAIAARSYMHHIMNVDGELRDGERDQVYTCGNPPRDIHRQAVADTAGQILSYKATVVASFYVAGSRQEGPSCDGNRHGQSGFVASKDPTGTEHFVTYNQGLSGAELLQSRQGLVAANNHANRGTMSQLGANCLADAGETTDHILRFYYGDDIELTQTAGPCIAGTSGGGTSPLSVDIGKPCTEDTQCGASAPAGSCNEWFVQSVDQTFGMCMASCTDACPIGAFCAELDGSGQCLPTPSASNGFCAQIPGTVPRILGKPNADSATTDDWGSVCAPPQVGTSCHAPLGAKGECINTQFSSCPEGTVITGECPGAGSVQCCLR